MGGQTCSVEHCDRSVYGLGLCNAHYKKQRKYGDPIATRQQNVGRTCSVPDCATPARKMGMCASHYMRDWWSSRDRPERVRCSIESCAEPRYGNGLCSKHYRATQLPQKRVRELKARYGTTIADYDAMYVAQGGRCAICQTEKHAWQPGGGLSGRDSFLHVDHDHKAGAVRGLLCSNCNLGIGKFKDDVTIVIAAAQYLTKYTAEVT